MGRKKKTPDSFVPPPIDVVNEPPKAKNSKIVVKKGDWVAFLNGLGMTKVQFLATFEDDPDGCRGYGRTKEEAIKTLHYYDEL